jgi:CRISPR-associated endonuclease/helicase Cas3
MECKRFVLTGATKSLWGKLSYDESHQWLPLWVHLNDTAEVAKLLWDHWLPTHTKEIICQGINDVEEKERDKTLYARKIAIFLAASHDIGKASPIFQGKADKEKFKDVVDEVTEKGLPISLKLTGNITKNLTHAVIGQKILEEHGLDRSYAVVVGGHHGKPPNENETIEDVASYPSVTGVGDAAWDMAQDQLLQFALNVADLSKIPAGTLSIQAQVLLTGFLIMADWIASGDEFPLLSRDYAYLQIEPSAKRAKKSWELLRLPWYKELAKSHVGDTLYDLRFGIKNPRPMQLKAIQIAQQIKRPGIFIIEAPMGEGKTEAALAVAEIFMRKSKMDGLYFALPTQATSDGIFKRIEKWIEHLRTDRTSIFLAHGKAMFNEDYEAIKINSNIIDYDNSYASKPKAEAVVVNDWTQGRKKGLLSDFVVGTIDQILMCGLKQKHLALRHLGVANKVVIVDECHAYDTYMSSYLDLVLSWLGAYHVPVIVLSATLPPARRQKLLEAYQESNKVKVKKPSMLALVGKPKIDKTEKKEPNIAYPLISYTDDKGVGDMAPPKSKRKLSVNVEMLDEKKLVETLQVLLAEGGCAGIICNTVQRAQNIAKLMEDNFGKENVRLLHSRFVSCDRVKKEKEVRALLGPPSEIGEEQRPKKLLVVGTQVLEQSLDVDFDVLLTDICPMDLLLQRMGRLHRHNRKKLRPVPLRNATCFIMGMKTRTEFDEGSVNVYGNYLLLKTSAFLKDKISLPDDISMMVQQAYDETFDEEMIQRLSQGKETECMEEICAKAIQEHKNLLDSKEKRAETFQIMKPQKQGRIKSLVGWLKADLNDKKDKSGKRGEATVRDTDMSIEVLVVVKKADGYFYTLPGLETCSDQRIEGIPKGKIAKIIAGCSVALPGFFTKKWNVDDVIEELEKGVLENNLDQWYDSYWLDGELFLVLNEQHEMKLRDKMLLYDARYGLVIKETEV